VKNLLFLAFSFIAFAACSKGNNYDNPTLGDVSVKAVVSTDSSGNVTVTATAVNSIGYDFDFGDGTVKTATLGTMTYKYAVSGTYAINVVASGTGGQSKSNGANVTVAVKSNLVWSDEFDTPGAPDPTKWGFDIGTGSGGWGNNELEYYTSRPDNVIVSNGTLKIIAKKETFSGSGYTSARMLTQNLYSFKYGKIEIRAKLPATTGTWPGIWMLGGDITTTPWPACGEIDIMEQSGSNKGVVLGTMHYPTQKNPNGDGGSTSVTNPSSDFHRYAAIWSATSIQMLVDDVVYYTLPIDSSTPFNQNFFILLNLAIGGNFGGTVDPAFTTDQLEIDYIRVYQ
jgi:beta-glucanase (GH16 family)